MTITNLLEALLGVAGIVWICGKQLMWTAVSVQQMWRMPIILGAIGVIMTTGSKVALTGADLGLLAIELVAAVATGAAMGWIAQFRPISPKALASWRGRRRRDDSAEPTVESRTGWIGIVLWVVLIAVRIGLAVLGHSMGSALAESSGIILLVIAVNRVVRTFIFSVRHDRHVALPAR
jgi:hypothetical protein